jgi:hypothetical protein
LDYRLYFLGPDQHIRDFLVIEGEDDDEAIRLAGHHANGSAMELWHRARMVRKFPADNEVPET